VVIDERFDEELTGPIEKSTNMSVSQRGACAAGFGVKRDKSNMSGSVELSQSKKSSPKNSKMSRSGAETRYSKGEKDASKSREGSLEFNRKKTLKKNPSSLVNLTVKD